MRRSPRIGGGRAGAAILPLVAAGWLSPMGAPAFGAPEAGWGGARMPAAPAASPPARYRFRGDAAPRPGEDAASGNDDGGYQFRPLNELERDRMHEVPGWRPLESRPESGLRPPALFDAPTPPPPQPAW